MPTLNEVHEQIKRLDNMSKFLASKEIKELPNILWENENIQDLIQGTYNKKIGLLAATDKRLIFIDKGLLWGLKVEDFSYDKISSIQYDTGLIFGTLTIFASGNRAQFEQIVKDQCKNFGDHVRNLISPQKEPSNAMPLSTGSNSPDFLEKLKELAKLKEQGILSDDEFLQAKKKLLD